MMPYLPGKRFLMRTSPTTSAAGFPGVRTAEDDAGRRTIATETVQCVGERIAECSLAHRTCRDAVTTTTVFEVDLESARPTSLPSTAPFVGLLSSKIKMLICADGSGCSFTVTVTALAPGGICAPPTVWPAPLPALQAKPRRSNACSRRAQAQPIQLHHCPAPRPACDWVEIGRQRLCLYNRRVRMPHGVFFDCPVEIIHGRAGRVIHGQCNVGPRVDLQVDRNGRL